MLVTDMPAAAIASAILAAALNGSWQPNAFGQVTAPLRRRVFPGPLQLALPGR